jgi:O-antigen/teichoic acid export membrane protein
LSLGEGKVVPSLVWTSLILMSLLGLVATIVVWAFADRLVHQVLKIPAPLEGESLYSFYLLAVSIPIVTATVGLRGVLEAAQRFDLINLVRIPLGAFTYLGPLAVLPFSRSLLYIVAVLLVGRVVACVVHLLLCFRLIPALKRGRRVDRHAVRPLLQFGSWITLSNVISPIMVSMDRFAIGAMISVTAVAYYTAPYEAVTKLWLIPAALTGVLFPAFASAWVLDPSRAARLFTQGVKYTLLMIYPAAMVFVALGHEGIGFWLGQDYAQNSTRVLQWLAMGVLFNCLAQIPSALIQAIGRPDITAKFHILELPLYLAGLWWMIHAHGIEGAAIAWTARCLVDGLALFVTAKRLVHVHTVGPRVTASIICAAAFPLVTILVQPSIHIRLALLGAAAGLFGALAWSWLLGADERKLLQVRR